jgi:hypothetical protein
LRCGGVAPVWFVTAHGARNLDIGTSTQLQFESNHCLKSTEACSSDGAFHACNLNSKRLIMVKRRTKNSHEPDTGLHGV